MAPIPVGVTRPKRALLEQDGVRMQAIFRDVDIRRNVMVFEDGTRQPFFRDQALFECAAYQLSRMLGMEMVPAVVERTIERRGGSLQIWIEGAVTDRVRLAEGRKPPDAATWSQQIRTMTIFDRLIANSDRSQDNMLIDQNWKIWLIDHTRAFRHTSDIGDMSRIDRIEAGLWERLKELEEEAVRQRLGPYLTDGEMESLLERRRRLVEHFSRLIAERGEAAVLYRSKDRHPQGWATRADPMVRSNTIKHINRGRTASRRGSSRRISGRSAGPGTAMSWTSAGRSSTRN